MNKKGQLFSLNRKMLDEELLLFGEDLQRFIFTLTRDDYIKEDIFHNVVIRSYKSIDKIERPWETEGNLRGWLIQIAKTETYRHFHNEKRWILKTGTQEFKEDAPGMEREEPGYSVMETLQRNEQLYQLVTTLHPDLSQVILAHYVYEMPLYEIARVTAKNYGTVRTRHKRALRILRRQYEQLWETKGEGCV